MEKVFKTVSYKRGYYKVMIYSIRGYLFSEKYYNDLNLECYCVDYNEDGTVFGRHFFKEGYEHRDNDKPSSIWYKDGKMSEVKYCYFGRDVTTVTKRKLILKGIKR